MMGVSVGNVVGAVAHYTGVVQADVTHQLLPTHIRFDPARFVHTRRGVYDPWQQ